MEPETKAEIIKGLSILSNEKFRHDDIALIFDHFIAGQINTADLQERRKWVERRTAEEGKTYFWAAFAVSIIATIVVQIIF